MFIYSYNYLSNKHLSSPFYEPGVREYTSEQNMNTPPLVGTLVSIFIANSRRSLCFFCSTPGLSLVPIEVTGEERTREEVLLM